MDDQLTLFDTGGRILCADLFYPHSVLVKRGGKRVTVKLSRRELQVMTGLANGLTQVQIALALDIAPSTVQKYKQNIRNKTGCQSITSAMYVVTSQGLIAQDIAISSEL